MGGGRIGEMVFNDPPGSFGAMSLMEQMRLERELREVQERQHERERKVAESVVSKTVEFEGEYDG